MSLGEQATNALTGTGDQQTDQQWGELTEVEQTGQCVINKQESNQGNTRYITITGNRQGQAAGVESDGSLVVLEQLNSMSEAPWHSSMQSARQACQAADLPKQWGQFEQVETHNGGAIMKQTAEDGSERFIAIAPDSNGNRAAVATDGSLVSISEETTGSDLPTYPNIGAARSALNETEGPTRQWGPLEQVGQEGNCVIMKQKSSDDNTRYFTITQSSEGETIALANDGTGKVVSSVDNAQELPHYPTESDARGACTSNNDTPRNGGSNETTDDSTSSDGPTSTDTSESSNSTTNTGLGIDGGGLGILSGDIAGIPIPVVGAGAALSLGAVASVLGGGDSPSTSTTTPRANQQRTQRRGNVTRRGSNSGGN